MEYPDTTLFRLVSVLKKMEKDFNPVIPFNPETDKLYSFDFSGDNKELSPELITDTDSFAEYILEKLNANHCKFGIGGYNENRVLYARSRHFGQASSQGPAGEEIQAEEPRRLHLGTDIWGPAGTKIMAPLDGLIHSFGYNNNDSDYGATIILTHNLEGIGFYTLYGHLSLNSLKNLQEGNRVSKGQVFAEFGMRFENGNWPPHLHFQLIRDMEGWQGDYPGVCKYSERELWLKNCPDPDLILRLTRFLGK